MPKTSKNYPVFSEQAIKLLQGHPKIRHVVAAQITDDEGIKSLALYVFSTMPSNHVLLEICHKLLVDLVSQYTLVPRIILIRVRSVEVYHA